MLEEESCYSIMRNTTRKTQWFSKNCFRSICEYSQQNNPLNRTISHLHNSVLKNKLFLSKHNNKSTMKLCLCLCLSLFVFIWRGQLNMFWIQCWVLSARAPMLDWVPPFLRCYSEALFRQMFFDIMKGHNSLAMFFHRHGGSFKLKFLNILRQYLVYFWKQTLNKRIFLSW